MATQGPIIARGRHERADYIRMRLGEHVRSARGLGSLALSLGGLGILVALALIDADKRALYLGEAFAFLALAAALPLLVLHQARRAWTGQPAFREAIEYLADAEGVEERRADSEGRAAWGEFRAVRERRDYFCLDLGRGRLAYLPKRFFGSPGDVAGFRALAAGAGKGR